MRQTLCAMIASMAAATVIVGSPRPFAVAAQKAPAVDLEGSYIPVLETNADQAGSQDQTDATKQVPQQAPPKAVLPAKSSPKATTNSKTNTSANEPAEIALSADEPAQQEPAAPASRRRQPNVKPSDPVDVPKAKPLSNNIKTVPGTPARAARPLPPAAPHAGAELAPATDPEIEGADDGVGTGADAPAPLPEGDSSFSPESFSKTPSRPLAAPSELRPRQLSPQMEKLRHQVRSTLGFYHNKHLNIRDHNPWEVMHSIVAYGAAAQLDRVQPKDDPVNAICWMCWNGDCKGIHILDIEDGRVAARKGPYVQGHPGQFLAILAQSRVATNCPMRVDGRDFLLEDLIESEKLGCRPKTELTFKLISMAYYLEIDAKWKSSDGQDWSIDRLIKEELAQPIVGAACGGTHRLMGLAYGVRKREMSGLPITGEFARARKFLDDYHRYTFKMQNPDGSFSTEWFKGPGARPDLARRIQTSGHILEWLSYSLSLDELDEPRVVKAVTYLSGVLHRGKTENWSVGPLGHALHALAIYDDRYFRQFDPPSNDDEMTDDGQIIPTVGVTKFDDQATAAAEVKPDAEAAPAEQAATPASNKEAAEQGSSVKASAEKSSETSPQASANRIKLIQP